MDKCKHKQLSIFARAKAVMQGLDESSTLYRKQFTAYSLQRNRQRKRTILVKKKHYEEIVVLLLERTTRDLK